MSPEALWSFLPVGYLLTVVLEIPVLLLLLSPAHPLRRRLLAGLWLTACTYPVVVLVLPLWIPDRLPYLLVAEVFAPAAECGLFALAFQHGLKRAERRRDWLAIILANLVSFGVGEWLGRFL